MISTKIFYFSLLSLSWMSAVNAGPKNAQHPILSTFLKRTDQEADWAGAYQKILKNPELLDGFFDTKIENLEGHVDHYKKSDEKSMGTAVDDAGHPAPDPHPALNHELNTLPKLVYLLRYSNLDVLNNIKLSGVDHPRLMKIDDNYLKAVSAKYLKIDQTEPERDFDIYIYELALLYAVNRPILPAISDELPELHERLELHHDMVSRLHQAMATFMQIRNRLPYTEVIGHLVQKIHILRTNGVHGYLNKHISAVFNYLSTGILCTIAIWGSADTAGTELMSQIIDEHAAIRFFAHLDGPPYDDREKVAHRVMMNFLKILGDIRAASPGYFPLWFDHYIPMVMAIINLSGFFK